MTKTLSLLIKNEPALTAAALRFAKAIDPSNTRVDCVFSSEKVFNMPLEITGTSVCWARVVGAHLILCSASAETFGLAPDHDFSVEGLGELFEAGLNSDKVVSFG